MEVDMYKFYMDKGRSKIIDFYIPSNRWQMIHFLKGHKIKGIHRMNYKRLQAIYCKVRLEDMTNERINTMNNCACKDTQLRWSDDYMSIESTCHICGGHIDIAKVNDEVKAIT